MQRRDPMALKDELKKRNPFDLVEQETALSIMRTSDLLGNRFARLFRHHGLTASQYNVLRILRGEGRPMPCLEVADRMIQVAPAITRVVNQLLELELIVKTQCPQDRRVFHIELNAAAKRLLKKIDKPLLDLHASLLSDVPKKDLRTLIEIMENLRMSVSD
jgi:DNA-binding MarR family transcriptional regulator